MGETPLTKTEELNLFLEKADEFIGANYILADIKIVNLLKAIVSSETLIAVFKNCLDKFDYEEAKQKYLVKSKYVSGDRGEFILPSSSKELLAFIFNILVDIDGKKIDFSEFLNKYFYEDGSFSLSYASFINAMIKPFRNAVKMLMESVIEGKLQDPVEAIIQAEEQRAKEEQELKDKEQKEAEMLKKAYGENIKAIKDMLLKDKTKLKDSKLKEDKKREVELVIDMLANVIESDDKDAIDYAFVSYKFMVSKYPIRFFNRKRKISKLIKDVINAI